MIVGKAGLHSCICYLLPFVSVCISLFCAQKHFKTHSDDVTNFIKCSCLGHLFSWVDRVFSMEVVSSSLDAPDMCSKGSFVP